MNFNIREEQRNNFLVTTQRKKIWKLELDILQRLLEVCQCHGLQCWLDSGSLLGAVRHHGFIPWDDDIDVVMFRDDYDKLMQIGPSEFIYPMFFQSAYTDRNYFRGHVQIRNSETTAILPSEYDRKFNQGIFIDIFPLDALPVSEKEYIQLEKKSIRMKEKMIRYHHLPFLSLFEKHCFQNIVKWILSEVEIGLAGGLRRYYAKYENLFRRNKINNVIQLTKISSFSTKYRGIDKHIFNETIWLPFENILVPVPKEYDMYLKMMYGDDYMTPSKVSSFHGEVYFDTEHSYAEVLPQYRKEAQSIVWHRKLVKLKKLFILH